MFNHLLFNRVLQAVADPTRRQILTLLRENDMNAGDIARHFQMSLPSMSHHLNMLKQCELVFAERQGQFIVYSLNTTVMQEVLQGLMTLLHVGEKEEIGEKRSKK